MSWNGNLVRLDENRWQIPSNYMEGMKTDAVIFANDSMVEQIKADSAPQQVANVACIPGIVGKSIAMPDIHLGYGFPIGGVAAVNVDDGFISPGGIGFDINCGVRLIRTDLLIEDISKNIDNLMNELFKNIPSGLGSKGLVSINLREVEKVLMNGSEWAIENGYGWEKDLEFTEESGKMLSADSQFVSEKARKRGLFQLGSLGSGNHFLELDVVDKIFDEDAAKVFGLKEGQVTITIHCGSRGCGYQIAADYIQEMEHYVKENNITIPDKQLSCAPLESDIGNNYFSAMSCGANYAWANRQLITHWIRKSFENVMNNSSENMGIDVVYDVAHNIAKKERHSVDGKATNVLVHRKGATRAFCAERPEVPMRYRTIGQPVIIPGDMVTGTYVLVGEKGAMNETFGSSCHGAGRKMSRKLAAESIDANSVKHAMMNDKIQFKIGNDSGIAEESPQAYKDVNQVVSVMCNSNLAHRVVKLKPIGVVKG
ncbi:MAG: RtcB family protein [archaeon]|nr:RtcB family protein [archaeon]